MGEIYSEADEVLIWLGHDQKGVNAMELIRDWDSDKISTAEGYERALSLQVMMENVSEAVAYLLLLPYWGQVWIIQEVVLAKKAGVVYGRISLGLDDFRSKVDCFRKTKTQFSYQPTIWSLCELRDKGRRKPLWDLMIEFELCQSTKTIDRVYGVLGLVADPNSEPYTADLLEVNYEKGTTEVFWDTIFECGAPWNQYYSVLLSMGKMLWEAGTPAWDFRKLEEYAKGKRPSNKHA